MKILTATVHRDGKTSLKPLKPTQVSVIHDGKVISTHTEMLPDMDAPDIDDGTLTISKLIELLNGMPDKSKKVLCSADSGFIKEGITGVKLVDDPNVVILSTTGD